MASIVVKNVSKLFRRYSAGRPATLQEAVARGLRRMRPVDSFWALQDVTLSVARGSTVAIIGANGSGKSTLLRLIAGIGRPDSGSIEVTGRLAGLLNISAAFHPDLSGRENATLAAVLGGMTRREARERLDEIVSFAEVEPFIDNPVRTYSSGMQMRLAFSTAIHVRPDVLLIDEVLSVGDIAFQHKCLERISAFKQEGCSIVLVTHDTGVAKELCDEIVWLQRGRVMLHGAPDAVVRAYIEAMEASVPG